MKIQVFAMLKDYFDKEFFISGNIMNTASLKARLAEENPEAAGVLDICRFAVNDEFIDNNYQFSENDTICILPPASGG
jgi:molybdopterin synthase sulfur carrier subunit